MTAKQIKEAEADEAIERHRRLVNSESRFDLSVKERLDRGETVTGTQPGEVSFVARRVGTHTGRISCGKPQNG